MYEGLVKSLRWLGFMFPETHPAQDDADRMSNNIHLYCTQAADVIEELTDNNVGKWISVEERLPEHLTSVIVHRKDGGIFMWEYFDTSPTDECLIDDSMNVYSFYDVTHWMPLPEPPKQAEEETS